MIPLRLTRVHNLPPAFISEVKNYLCFQSDSFICLFYEEVYAPYDLDMIAFALTLETIEKGI